MFEDLSDLVDNPRETLEIELKQWMDLEDRVNRATVARHLAALSNHGGGYLVFGFRDDSTPDPARPASLDQFSRDTFRAFQGCEESMHLILCLHMMLWLDCVEGPDGVCAFT